MKLDNSIRNSIVPGMILAFVIAYVSEFIHKSIVIGGQKPISGVIIAILLGMLVKNTVGVNKLFEPGINFAMKKVLKAAIFLLGLGLSFITVVTTGSKALMIIVVCVTFAITATYFFGRKMGLPDKLATLIGIGTAICGSTAIVAASPAIDAKDEEVTFSVATITIFGVLAIFLYPLIGKVLLLTDMQFGTWAGVAVHETAQVVAAGFAYSDPAGQIATVVKLTRTVLLAPIVLILGVIYTRRQKDVAGGQGQRVNYFRIFPWFVVGFLAMAGLRTFGDTIWLNSAVWTSFLSNSQILSKFLIVTAMAGVGLLTSFNDMRTVGIRPFIVGLVASLIMAVFSITLIFALGI
ncbi:YeiH family protein [Desulfotomaculum sp. 1211_IL3151]|uniref:YeiH family protein n=1 Tax=Desulfotomaculum sp. 1211_IL3151 TaxID=3084055 RepID=UPI002FDB82B9